MGNSQAGIPLIPPMPLIDMVEVLETRNLNFNKEFSFEYCDEVACALEKVMQYDKLMGTPKDGLYLRITLSTPGGYVYGLMKVLEKVENQIDTIIDERLENIDHDYNIKWNEVYD